MKPIKQNRLIMNGALLVLLRKVVRSLNLIFSTDLTNQPQNLNLLTASSYLPANIGTTGLKYSLNLFGEGGFQERSKPVPVNSIPETGRDLDWLHV